MANFKVHGTVQELEALNIPLNQYPTCSKKSLDGTETVILGCPVWRACKLAEKRAGVGPVNKGVRLVKRGVDGRTRIVNTTLTCYDIPWWEGSLEPMGGAVQVVAGEGEDILLKGTRSVPHAQPGHLPVIEEFTENTPVPKFPRPGTPPNLGQEAGVKEILEQMKHERMEQRLDKAAGMKDSDGPRAKGK